MGYENDGKRDCKILLRRMSIFNPRFCIIRVVKTESKSAVEESADKSFPFFEVFHFLSPTRSTSHSLVC